MTTSNIIPVKYIFLDVVAYTKRTVEAECYIIKALNRIVKGAINRYHISDDFIIYIPTGDGMCIGLLGITLQYDIHLTIAKEILRRLYVNNSRVKDSWRKFEVRVGINQSDDNIVTDIKGEKNVTGAGINNARRIMDLADGSQILVSSVVYDNLHPRKQYYYAFSQELKKEVKHGLVLKMYQFIQSNVKGVDINTPSAFVTQIQPESLLPKLTAYYFAHSIKNETDILDIAIESPHTTNWLRLLLWFLAKDSEEASTSTPTDIYKRKIMPDTGSDNFRGHFRWFYENVPADVAIDLSYVVVDNAVPSPFRSKYLSHMSDYLVVEPSGKDKLKKEHPQIWDELGLA